MSAVLRIALWTLRDARGGTIGLALATFGLSLGTALLYPSYRDSFAEIELPAAFEGFLGEAGSLGSPEGFLTAEVFSWVPLLVVVFAVVWGTGTLAGEEAAGTLDLLLAQPVSRRALLAGKAAGLAVALTVVTAAMWPGLAIGTAAVGTDIGVGALAAAVAGQVPLVLLYLAVGLLAAAALPSRRSAAVLTTAALVAAYFLNAVGAGIESMEEARDLSPFRWADASREMIDGPQPLRWAALVAVALVVLAAAAAFFDRREIGSARLWPARWRLHHHPAVHGQHLPGDEAGGG